MRYAPTALVALLALVFAFAGCEKKQPARQESSPEIKTLTTNLNTARSELNALKSKFAGLQAELGSTKLQLTRAQDEITGLKSELSRLQAQLKTSAQKTSRPAPVLPGKTVRKEISKDRPKQAPITQDDYDSPGIEAEQKSLAPGKTTKTTIIKDLQSQPPSSQNPPPSKSSVLAGKFQEAQSYVQGGNWPAAERLYNEIRSADPAYPGLDMLNSMIQTVKSRQAPPGAGPGSGPSRQ